MEHPLKGVAEALLPMVLPAAERLLMALPAADLAVVRLPAAALRLLSIRQPQKSLKLQSWQTRPIPLRPRMKAP
jgi:hypothetical protein